jgi:hypothetical protein
VFRMHVAIFSRYRVRHNSNASTCVCDVSSDDSSYRTSALLACHGTVMIFTRRLGRLCSLLLVDDRQPEINKRDPDAICISERRDTARPISPLDLSRNARFTIRLMPKSAAVRGNRIIISQRGKQLDSRGEGIWGETNVVQR